MAARELNDTIDKKDKKITEIDNERESQWSKFKRLLMNVLKNPDTSAPLKERLEILFKAFGVTIASIIAAITMIFTTIGLAISNALSGAASSGGGGGGGGDKPPSIPDRVKEGLKKFAEWRKVFSR